MDTKQNDMTPHAAAEALRWLAEMGADEIIGESPVNRLAAPAAKPVATPAAAPAAAPVAVTPGAPAAQCRSLAEIAAALEGFDACPLKKTATRLCYADGNPEARVMLVGEAPGRDEDIQGKPFVGRSGQLLDRMLAAVGLSRAAQDRDSAVFITNTIFWRPPGNRTPTEAETQMCLPFLLRTIELQKPDVIVCLGATPAHRLTGRSDGILKLRGRWVTATVSGRNIPLLPTLHPAYLLRQPAQKRLAWRDMLSLRQMLDAH
ncbi:MAG: uracil-DNA glycosylase [Hyphomicrobiales bacterium]